MVLECSDKGELSAIMKVKPIRLEQIIAAQDRDPTLCKIKAQLSKGRAGDFEVGRTKELRISKRLCVPQVDNV